MRQCILIRLAGTVILATTGFAAQAVGPDWSLIITGPGLAIPPAPPIQAAPVRVIPAPAGPAAGGGHPVPAPSRHDNGSWERERADHDHRFQDRENYYLERERVFQARERAFLEREKQRLLVVENNQRALQAINNRQDEQLDRIVEGVNMNRISKDEFSALMSQQKQIRNLERAFLNDGFLSQDEYQQLNAKLDATDQAIRFGGRRSHLRGRGPYPQGH